MAFQKWIVLYAFLSLFTFMMEIRSSSACLKEVILQIEKTIIDLQTCENWNYSAVARNCADLHKSGENGTSGVHSINPDDGVPFDVYCDQTTEGGGWTVIQKRFDGSVDFYLDWLDYKRGFGNLGGEFWLGLEKINRLTKEGKNRLRVELTDHEGNTSYAEYDMFAVTSENVKYRLSLGTFSGNTGDSLTYHLGAPFSTRDQDNDYNSGKHSAEVHKGGWWYTTGRDSNLNSLYHNGTHSSRADGINWYKWKGDYYSAIRCEMKIRPADF